MGRFEIHSTTLQGLAVIRRQPLGDARGFLSRLFCAEELAAAGWNKPVAQGNHTLTKTKGTVRGLHYQLPPHAETKLVTCIRGAIWDVAVDLRAGSPTFLRWHAELLSAENNRALLIPRGFAHGFQTMTDDCELIYLHDIAYAAGYEGACNATDIRLGVAWPLAISERSDRDTSHPLLAADFTGLIL